MRGWVYIISNKAMPGLLKVGFSLKDPHARAKELNHTGSPHPYIVEFDVLVIEPHNIEQRVHSALKTKREGKEWFKCSLDEAISVVKGVAGSSLILHGTQRSTEAQPLLSSADRENPADAVRPTVKRTGTYAGYCKHCGDQFTVTLTRYDSEARCPNCFRTNDASAFIVREFVI